MIRTFFYNITIYSVQYLGWVTAIVAAILSLTTVIFSQQNERIINQSNDIALDLQEIILADDSTVPPESIAKKFTKMVLLLTSRSVHLGTMILFVFISILIDITWIIGAIGYGMDADFGPDKILITASTVILVVPFLVIPILLMNFNKNQIIKTVKQRVKIIEAISFFQIKDGISKGKIIKDYISPILKINIDINGKLSLLFSDQIPVGGYKVTCRFQSTDAKILVHFPIDYRRSQHKYKIKNRRFGNVDATFQGLYKLLKDARTRCDILISSDDRELIQLFDGLKSLNIDNEIIIKLSTPKNDSVDSDILDVISYSEQVIKVIKSDGEMQYSFEQYK